MIKYIKHKLSPLLNPIPPVINGNYLRQKALFEQAHEERKAEIAQAKQQEVERKFDFPQHSQTSGR